MRSKWSPYALSVSPVDEKTLHLSRTRLEREQPDMRYGALHGKLLGRDYCGLGLSPASNANSRRFRCSLYRRGQTSRRACKLSLGIERLNETYPRMPPLCGRLSDLFETNHSNALFVTLCSNFPLSKYKFTCLVPVWYPRTLDRLERRPL